MKKINIGNIPELNEPTNILGMLTRWMVGRQQMVYLVIILVTIAGMVAYIDIPRESMPEVVLPYAEIVTIFPGASPEDVESFITNKIENEISSLKDLDETQSFSSSGLSRISLRFDYGIDLEIKKTEILNAINRVELPVGVEMPTVTFFATSGEPILGINLYGDYSPYDLSEVAVDIKERLERLNGVDKVNIAGDIKREIHIYIDIVKLMNYSLTLAELQDSLLMANFTMPAGDGNFDGTQYSIRINESFNSIKDIERHIVVNRKGEKFLLKDIAEVVDSHERIKQTSRINIKKDTDRISKTSIYLTISRKDGEDVIDLVTEIKEVLESEKGLLYPEALNIFYWNDESIQVASDLNNVIQNAFSGLLVVVCVLFLFIGFRESVIVSFVIPLSLLTTISYLNYQGMSLNMLSILGLIVSLGLLVDNAIVVMENIDRIRSKGIDKITASKVATNQVAPAILASTMTTIAAFIPLMMLPGDMGAFITTLPKTIIVALIASLCVSLLITPTLCVLFLPEIKKDNSKSNVIKVAYILIVMIVGYYALSDNGAPSLLAFISSIVFGLGMWFKQFKLDGKSFEESQVIKWYERKIREILTSKNKRLKLIFIATLLVIISIMTIPAGVLKVGLVQYADLNAVKIDIKAPYGTPLDETYDITKQVEQVLNQLPEITHYGSNVGENSPHTARINVELLDKSKRERHMLEVVEALRIEMGKVPGAIINVAPVEDASAQPGHPFQLRFKGNDINQLKITGEEVVELLNETKGIINPSMNLQDGIPQLRVDINKNKASVLGLSPQQVGFEIRGYLSGINVGQYKENEDEFDIVLKTSDNWVDSIDDLKKIHFVNSSNDRVPFESVVNLSVEKDITMIRHIDYNRVVVVGADIDTNANLNEIMSEFLSTFDQENLPEGIVMEIAGQEAEFNEMFLGLFQSMMIAMALVYIILVIQFNSVIQPFIILLTLPMGLIGVITGLLVTGNDFGFYAFMGLVALVGIVVNDAIVLVDYTNYLNRSGLNKIDALVEGATTRFIPVFATSITTIGGILPLAVKNVYYAQLGFGIVFGLLVATLMTLVYIPIFYSFLVKAKESGGNHEK